MRLITLMYFIVVSFKCLSQFTFEKRFNNEIFLDGPFNSINNLEHFFMYGYAGVDTLKPFFMSIDLFGNQLNHKSYNNDACQTYVLGCVKTKGGNHIGVGSSNTAVVQKLVFSKDKSLKINTPSLSRGLYFYHIKNEQIHLQSWKLLK